MGNRISSKIGVRENNDNDGGVATATAVATENNTNPENNSTNAACIPAFATECRNETYAKSLWNNLGVSGRIIAFAAIAGLACAFLPAVSWGVEVNGQATQVTVPVFGSLFGKIGFVCYVAVIGFGFALYRPNPFGNTGPRKIFVWTIAGCSVAAVLCAFATWLDAASGLDAANALGISNGYIAIGCYLNVVAAIGVSVGACLKVREERC